MNSIRQRLIVILLLTTGAVWASAVGWIYFSTRAQVERVLDARLSEAASMVHSLLAGQNISAQAAAQTLVGPAPSSRSQDRGYARQLSCQIWSLSGDLIARSDGAPGENLGPHAQGFSTTTIGAERWRVFAIDDPDLKVRVVVGDNLHMRDGLVADVIKGLLLPASLILPLLAGLIWFSVARGLSPLDRLAAALAARSAKDLRPEPSAHAPTEVRPMIGALNGLFGRLEAAQRRERDFIAFAAHELRTPVAGLKTQAQVALAARDEQTIRHALNQIVIAVDRTSRLVRQLLDMSQAERADITDARTSVGPALAAVVDDVLRSSGRTDVRVHIDPALDGLVLLAEPTPFHLATRNLLENAVAHAARDGAVTCRLARTEDGLAIDVEDDGAGVSPEELGRLAEPFFRGRAPTTAGSGLGLAIADVAMRRIGGGLVLANGAACGFRARLAFTNAQVSLTRPARYPTGGAP